jgi:peptidoglycan/LPS O-acetylase OafA/YrhL
MASDVLADPPLPAAPTVPDLGRIRGFDGLRGIGVILVLLHHTGYLGWANGRIGLNIFFCLSGFLITSILLKDLHKNGRVNFRRFYERRARRLLPALMVMLYGLVLYGMLVDSAVGFRKAFSSLPFVVLYAGNWYGIVEGMRGLGPLLHMWSLSVEEQFYVLWPVVLAVVVHRWRRSDWLLTICIVGSVASLFARLAAAQLSNLDHLRYGTDTNADQILIGCALAIILSGANEARRASLRRRSRLLVWPAGLLLVHEALIAPHYVTNSEGPARYPISLTLIALAAATVIAHVYLSPESQLARALSFRPLAYLGVISYGWYLWHVPVIVAIQSQLRPDSKAVLLLITAIITFSIGSLSYWFIEVPIREGGRRRPPTEPAAPVSFFQDARKAAVGIGLLLFVLPLVAGAMHRGYL